MRRHHTVLFSGTNNYHLSTFQNENNRNTITRRQELRDQSAYSFRNTDFDHCETQTLTNGGAIYCSTGSLTIEECIFSNCKSSNRSGSVFFQCQNLCNDTNNLFVNSSSDWNSGTFDDYFATQSIHFQSTYINSVSGGHFGIMNIEATSHSTVFSCIFVNGSAGDWTGLFSLTKISGTSTVSDCLFAFGKAVNYGGAFGTYEPFDTTAYPVFFFSFFYDNFCSDPSRGADFDANGTTCSFFSKEQILHCFSSSRGFRVYIEGEDSSDVDLWLPQGIPFFFVDNGSSLSTHTQKISLV